jgi:hypothetical protein
MMKILSTMLIPAAALAANGILATHAGAAAHLPLYGPEIEHTQAIQVQNYKRRDGGNQRYGKFRRDGRDHDRRRHWRGWDRDRRDNNFSIGIFPRIPFYVAPPVARSYVVPPATRYMAPNQCSNWAERCRDNWGYGANYRGCLRYHGCL